MLVFAAALLAAFYLWSYGDCLGAFFLNDDYWVLRAANGIVLESPIDLAQFFRPEPFFLREGDGNVGIMRSPNRAIALPDQPVGSLPGKRRPPRRKG
jgi:hypothetical protein